MNRYGLLAASTLIWWYRAIITMLTILAIVLITNLYVKVEPPTGGAERGIIVQRLLWEPAIVDYDSLTLRRIPGQLNPAKPRSVLDNALPYPEGWKKRYVVIETKRNAPIIYQQSNKALLLATAAVGPNSGASGSSTESTEIPLLINQDNRIELLVGKVNIWEQHS